VEIARTKRLAAYVGDGLNRWPAAHVLDVARLYRLALERGLPGARYNAVAEEGIAARDIVTAVGHGLGVPVASIPAEQANEYYGWLAVFASLDLSASSAKTREWLNWNPTGPGLLADLADMDYSAHPGS
jgi:nucleoside-diphosphate-sugar epimerase